MKAFLKAWKSYTAAAIGLGLVCVAASQGSAPSEIPFEFGFLGLTWKSFGRSLGLGKGTQAKEDEADGLRNQINALSKSNRKIYNNARAGLGKNYFFDTKSGKVIHARKRVAEDLSPGMSEGGNAIRKKSRYRSNSGESGLGGGNKLNRALLEFINGEIKLRNIRTKQELRRKEKGLKGYSGTGKKKTVKSKRSTSGGKGNQSSVSGRYDDVRGNSNSLKISGGGNL